MKEKHYFDKQDANDLIHLYKKSFYVIFGTDTITNEEICIEDLLITSPDIYHTYLLCENEKGELIIRKPSQFINPFYYV